MFRSNITQMEVPKREGIGNPIKILGFI